MRRAAAQAERGAQRQAQHVDETRRLLGHDRSTLAARTRAGQPEGSGRLLRTQPEAGGRCQARPQWQERGYCGANAHGREVWRELGEHLDEKTPFSPFAGGGMEVKATCGSADACRLQTPRHQATTDRRHANRLPARVRLEVAPPGNEQSGGTALGLRGGQAARCGGVLRQRFGGSGLGRDRSASRWGWSYNKRLDHDPFRHPQDVRRMALRALEGRLS